jgi:hypothetical protein
MTEHVVDELELYALGALGAGDADRVTAHLAACPACRGALEDIATAVNALPDVVAPREPPAGLRARILAAAAADARPEPVSAAQQPSRRPRQTRAWLGIGALAAAAMLLLALDLNSLRELRAAESERAEYALALEKVSHGGKSWYMVGLDQWRGSGGTLIAPMKADVSAFVVFHDLHPLGAGAMYAVWLVDADGHWVRAASFRPDGQAVQSVDLTVPVDVFVQCAVTIETASEGKRSGPLVMQSQIVPPAR